LVCLLGGKRLSLNIKCVGISAQDLMRPLDTVASPRNLTGLCPCHSTALHSSLYKPSAEQTKTALCLCLCHSMLSLCSLYWYDPGGSRPRPHDICMPVLSLKAGDWKQV